jgi:hypothetical protein
MQDGITRRPTKSHSHSHGALTAPPELHCCYVCASEPSTILRWPSIVQLQRQTKCPCSLARCVKINVLFCKDSGLQSSEVLTSSAEEAWDTGAATMLSSQLHNYRTLTHRRHAFLARAVGALRAKRPGRSPSTFRILRQDGCNHKSCAQSADAGAAVLKQRLKSGWHVVPWGHGSESCLQTSPGTSLSALLRA